MIKWFKKLSKQEKIMALLIVLLLTGVILRWDNLTKNALNWFRFGQDKEETTQPADPAENVSNIRSEQYIPDSLELSQDTIRLEIPNKTE